MRLEQEVKKSGFFWLSGSGQNKVPGTLVIRDGGDAELEIVGSLGESLDTHQGFNSIVRINGEIEGDGEVTLDGCHYKTTQLYRLVGGITKSKIYVQTVYCGAHYLENENITFESVSFFVEGLDEWIMRSGIDTQVDIKARTATIRYTHPEKISVPLDNGTTLEIDFEASFPNVGFNLTEGSVKQRACLNLKSDSEMEFSEFKELIFKLVHFVGFAVDAVTSLTKVVGSSSNVTRTLNDGEIYQVPVRIYYPSIPFVEHVPKLSWPEMLFTFPDIEAKAPDVFNRWIRAYDVISPSLNLYFAVQTGAYRYVDAKLLALTQSLETFQRRISDDMKLMPDEEFHSLVEHLVSQCPEEKKEWLFGRIKYGNEINLRTRLKNLIKPFKSYLGNKELRSKFIDRVVKVRNYLTHFTSDELDQYVDDGAVLYELCLLLEALFQLHSLRIIGFTDEEIAKIVKDCFRLNQKLKQRVG